MGGLVCGWFSFVRQCVVVNGREGRGGEGRGGLTKGREGDGGDEGDTLGEGKG